MIIITFDTKMKRFIFRLFVAVVAIASLISCTDDSDNFITREDTSHALYVFFPWTGNLTPFLKNNIEQMKKGLQAHDFDHTRLVVSFEYEPGKVRVFELQSEKNSIVEQTLLQYDKSGMSKEAYLRYTFQLFRRFAPSTTCSLIIGAHGMGWLPAASTSTRSGNDELLHWEYAQKHGALLTRYFGMGSGVQYTFDISELRDAIKAEGMKMNFIMFDDCYMSSVEVAYDLQGVTDYLIGCPTEIMAHGMPYDRMIRNLMNREDYNEFVDTFYDFYKDYYTEDGYKANYGTVSVIRLSEVPALAALMKEINGRGFPYNEDVLRNEVQRMDGYSPTIFFDLGDYVDKLCQDEELKARFNAQLRKVVVYKRHTPQFYALAVGGGVPIRNDAAFSGITTSAISISKKAADYKATSWYKATH